MGGTIIENKIITTPLTTNGDGIHCFGDNNPTYIENCIVDFSEIPVERLDEALSTIDGAVVEVKNSLFRGTGKLVLCGNGQYPSEDRLGNVLFVECTLESFGRRGVEAQDGVTVIMKNCIIRNWGIKSRFDIRAFAGWAHRGASITCINCKFEQHHFWQTGFWNFFVDIANHIGQAVNDRGLFGLTWKDLVPGVCRGLIATDKGKVKAVNCTKNHWWICIENSS